MKKGRIKQVRSSRILSMDELRQIQGREKSSLLKPTCGCGTACLCFEGSTWGFNLGFTIAGS